MYRYGHHHLYNHLHHRHRHCYRHGHRHRHNHYDIILIVIVDVIIVFVIVILEGLLPFSSPEIEQVCPQHRHHHCILGAQISSSTTGTKGKKTHSQYIPRKHYSVRPTR